MLMTDDTGWNDFGCYSGGGRALGHATPHVDRIAKEGAMFTSWYGQASCTAGRSSFITGRIPIRSALSIVVAPGDENLLRRHGAAASAAAAMRRRAAALLGHGPRPAGVSAPAAR
jgi:arylsulfatase